MTEPRVSHTRCADSGSDTDATALPRGPPAAGLPGEVGGPPDRRWVAPRSRVGSRSVPGRSLSPSGDRWAGPGGREAPARGPRRKAEVGGGSWRRGRMRPAFFPSRLRSAPRDGGDRAHRDKRHLRDEKGEAKPAPPPW